jgi:hypothetical protein
MGFELGKSNYAGHMLSKLITALFDNETARQNPVHANPNIGDPKKALPFCTTKTATLNVLAGMEG